MKILNPIKVLLLLLITLSVASCEEYYDDDYLQNSNDKLCGYTWLENYVTVNDEYCTHSIVFNRNGSGRETFAYQYFDINGNLRPVHRNSNESFGWEWVNNMEGIYIGFSDGYELYFDNVWVRDFYLSGVFDGEDATFRRADSPN